MNSKKMLVTQSPNGGKFWVRVWGHEWQRKVANALAQIKYEYDGSQPSEKDKKLKCISLSEKYNIPTDELEELFYNMRGDICDYRDVIRAVRLYQSQRDLYLKSKINLQDFTKMLLKLAETNRPNSN